MKYVPVRPVIISLVAANLIPLFGVLFLGWSLFYLLFLYWLESVIIGFYGVLKILFYNRLHGVPLAVFFCFHFGLFMIVHFAFIIAIFGVPEFLRAAEGFGELGTFDLIRQSIRQVGITGAALFVSHGVSFITYTVRGGAEREESRPGIVQLMTSPYSRIVVMHITVMLGGFVSFSLGSPVWALIVMVLLKTLIDVKLHMKEHQRYVFIRQRV